MKSKLLLLAFFFSFVYANDITLNWLKEKPRTYARDFYILQYLKQDNITSNDAQEALGLVNAMNNKLLFAYTNKLNHDESTAVTQCMNTKAKVILNSYADCIKVGLTIKKALKLDALELDNVILKVQTPYPAFAKILEVINAPIVFTKVISSDLDTFYEIFLKSSRSFRINKLNYKLSTRVIKKIKKDKRFAKLIHFVVTNPQMNLSQKSFFEIDDKEFSSDTSFLLAINLITHNKEQEAIKYLDNTYNKAYLQIDKDKALFWKYKITKNEEFLKEISNSWDINIYSMFAKEFFNTRFDNIIYDIEQKNKKTTYNVEDQFSWIDVIRDTKELDSTKIKKYENIFTTKETSAHLTFLYSKHNKYLKHYFINPYEKLISKYPLSRQILINAIARQESSFIPSSISTAYAQGVMQIMPFLSKAIAKTRKDEYNIYNMFKAEYSIKYANHHLNSLDNKFKHPLFIAYAYNGGGGFTSAILKNGLFNKGYYEPYLSMEKVPYSETREYGKKVLTNYVIYHNKFSKKKLKLTTLLEKKLKLSATE